MSRAPALVAALALVTPACIDRHEELRQITPEEVTALSVTPLRNMAAAWRDGALWLDDASFAASLADLAGGFVEDDGERPDDEADEDASVDELLDGLADTLEQDVLLPENLVSNDTATLVYAVPEDNCADGCDGPFDGQPKELRFTSPAAGSMTMRLMVGSPPVEVITFVMSDSTIIASLSISAIATLDRRSAAPTTDGTRLDSASGKVQLTISRLRADAVSVAAAIVDPINVRASANGATMNLSIGRSEAHATLDAGARTVDLGVDIGRVTLDAPFAFFSEPGDEVPDATMGLDLGGLTADLVLDEDAAAVVLQNVSLGDRQTAIKVNGGTILGVDLNRGTGRTVDLTMARDGDALDVSASPSLELAVTIALQQLTSLIPDFDPRWAANETMTIRLDGASPPAIRVHDDDGAVEVLAGRLTLDSTAINAADVSVSAGQCLYQEEAPDDEPFEDDVDDDDAHPFEAYFTAACE